MKFLKGLLSVTLLLIAFSSNNVFANQYNYLSIHDLKDNILMTFTNDVDNSYVDRLSVIIDNNDYLVGFNIKYGKDNSKKTIKLNELKKGASILSKSGKDIISIHSKSVDKSSGGVITLYYLYSGISNTKKTKKLDLSKIGNTWTLKYNNKVVKDAEIKVNKKHLVGVIGIRNINFY